MSDLLNRIRAWFNVRAAQREMIARWRKDADRHRIESRKWSDANHEPFAQAYWHLSATLANCADEVEATLDGRKPCRVCHGRPERYADCGHVCA